MAVWLISPADCSTKAPNQRHSWTALAQGVDYEVQKLDHADDGIDTREIRGSQYKSSGTSSPKRRIIEILV